MISWRALATLSSVFVLSACSQLPSSTDFKQQIGISTPLKVKEIVIGAIVLYYAKDGFIWEVEDRTIAPGTYRLTVKQGKLKSSGQGEARIYFQRRAESIASAQGCNGYTTLEYNESLVSDFLNIPQRVTEGVIRCNRENTTN